jgi:hypothetical protein
MPKESSNPTNIKSNRTLIILLSLVILSSITLGIMLALQNQNNEDKTPTPTDQANSVPSSEPISNQPPVVNTPSVTSEQVKAARETRVPDRSITQSQIDESVKVGSCWAIIDGIVYDLSEFLRRGRSFDLAEQDICGKEITKIITEPKEGQPPIEEVGPFSPYSRPVGKLVK